MTILLLLSLLAVASAEPITEAMARVVGLNFLLGKTSLRNISESTGLSLVYTAYSHNTAQPTPSFYVFNINAAKGFVVVSADDNAQPILGYSGEGNFDSTTIPIQLKELLDTYTNEIGYLIKNKVTAPTSIKNGWAELRNPAKKRKYELFGATVIVGPLIQTAWDQGTYYNQLCPYDYQNGGTTLTGCVATAMAQVMKYWSFPTTGVGTHSYTPPNGLLGVQTAIFDTTNYQWSLMPSQLTGSSTAAQVKAVATLMYDCGVSVEMEYGLQSTGGSLAYTISYGGQVPYCAENAFKTFFNYQSSISGILRSGYTDAQWINILENELNSSRPAICQGYNANGTNAHTYIVDGYDANNFFHCNWGWSGGYQGFFSINSMVPYVTDTFTFYQQALIGIMPNTTATTPEVARNVETGWLNTVPTMPTDASA